MFKQGEIARFIAHLCKDSVHQARFCGCASQTQRFFDQLPQAIHRHPAHGVLIARDAFEQRTVQPALGIEVCPESEHHVDRPVPF